MKRLGVHKTRQRLRVDHSCHEKPTSFLKEAPALRVGSLAQAILRTRVLGANIF